MRASRFKLAILRWLLRSKPIYNVCCALRGPDQFHDDTNPKYDMFGQLKVATTGVVRSKLGITYKRKGMSGLCITEWDSHHEANMRNCIRPTGCSHFLEHQREAFEALGLKWAKSNGSVKQ